MPATREYLTRTECRLASGRRLTPGERVRLSASAAKYPLLRGWIAEVAPPPPEPPAGEPRAPRGRRRG